MVAVSKHHTCIQQPRCYCGVSAQLVTRGVQRGVGGTAIEGSNLGVAVVHKALAYAAISRHIVADLG